MLYMLSLIVYTLRVEKGSYLSLLSIGSLSGSEEGGGNRPMMTELLNEAILATAT